MRVLHVITGLDRGGAESQLAALVATPRTARPEQRVVSLTAPGAVAERVTAAGVPVDSLDMRRGLPDPRALRRLARLMGTWAPDAIQSWMYHADLVTTLAWLLCGRRRRTRLFWGVRCSDMDTRHYGARLRLTIRLCAGLSGLPEAVIANSEAGQRVHTALGYRPRRFLVIPNGVDTERFRPDAEARAAVRAELGIDAATPLLAHVARADPMKDHATLFAAMDRLPGVEVLAVGVGTEDLLARRGLHRLGRCADMPRLYAACDLAVSTSAFGEGFSNAIAEGMAAGLPAVATDVGDARIIVGASGRIVPPRDPAALAAAVADLLALPASERAALGYDGRKHVAAKFSLARAALAFDAVHRGEEVGPCAA